MALLTDLHNNCGAGPLINHCWPVVYYILYIKEKKSIKNKVLYILVNSFLKMCCEMQKMLVNLFNPNSLAPRYSVFELTKFIKVKPEHIWCLFFFVFFLRVQTFLLLVYLFIPLKKSVNGCYIKFFLFLLWVLTNWCSFQDKS